MRPRRARTILRRMVQEPSATTDLIEAIRANVIGDDEAVVGPFGLRRVTYADYTASGRSLAFIEDFIREAVLPLYGNTHTESSGTGRQTTRFREDARRIIRDAVGANAADHVVLFAGSGSTGAIDRLIDCPRDPPAGRPRRPLRPARRRSRPTSARSSSSARTSTTATSCPGANRWPTSSSIPEDHDGRIDLARLEAALIEHADRPLKIGSFSAASNVTGVLSDVRAISILLHRHGALSFWDFAAAAPYVSIEMGPFAAPARPTRSPTRTRSSSRPTSSSAGPGRPASSSRVASCSATASRACPAAAPSPTSTRPSTLPRPTSSIARRAARRRSSSRSAPASCSGSRRRSGADAIREREASFIQRAIERWARHPTIEILGNPALDRLSIVSFVVPTSTDGGQRYLHHNYVVALLNDLFGIQSRGGCSCAGPYGHRLLGIDLEHSHEFEREIGRGCEGIKPGWVRVNFNYFISEPVFEFILEAVELVATDGWRLLPHYRFEPATGLWQHAGGTAEPPLSLFDVEYGRGEMTWPAHRRTEPESRSGRLPRRGAPAPGRPAAADRSARADRRRRRLRDAPLVPVAVGDRGSRRTSHG